jgi:hypothetical protein
LRALTDLIGKVSVYRDPIGANKNSLNFALTH